MTSATTTQLADRLMLTFAMFALIGVIYLLMHRGWQRQRADQEFIPAPPTVGSAEPKYHGVYASTTFAGQPLKRVVVHGLGVRSSVDVGISSDAIELHRSAATSFSIPFTDLIGVSKASAIAGKVVGDNGLVLLTWRLGNTEVDTGLLIRDEGLIEELADLV